jgi:hypothetical protein
MLINKYLLNIKVFVGNGSEVSPSLVSVYDKKGNTAVLPESKIKCLDVLSKGEISFVLPEGDYLVKVSKGLAYESKISKVNLLKDEDVVINLSEWFNFHDAGLFTGDCHNHINYPTDPSDMTAFMEASGIDTISLCQGWLSPLNSSRSCDGKRLAEYLESLSSGEAHVFMGAEFPKTRFGHICWWRFPVISDPFGCYDSYHDSDYFKIAGITDIPIENPATEYPFMAEAPIFKTVRWKRQGGVSMAPHPTSWWLTNENAKLICTNIAVDYCFSLLAGADIYDTLAVMGYDADQVFYQNLWFHLLNEGYTIAAVAETDGDLLSKHKIGSLRSYAHCGKNEFDRNEFIGALCTGRSFMTSGPILMAKADDKFLPGEKIMNNGGRHSIKVTAKSHPDPEEYLSWLVLYRNGRLAELVDVEDRKLKIYEHEFSFNVDKTEREWYVVKVYGKDRPSSKDFADVMTYCELCEKESHCEYAKIKQVAFTNPFYFESEGFSSPKTLSPPLSGIVRDGNGRHMENITVSLIEDGKIVGSVVTDKTGSYLFSTVSLLSEIELSGPGCKRLTKSIYMDYPPLVKYFEYIYSGKWAIANKNLKPGQVPWSVFRFHELRTLLSIIEWDLTVEQKNNLF